MRTLVCVFICKNEAKYWPLLLEIPFICRDFLSTNSDLNSTTSYLFENPSDFVVTPSPKRPQNLRFRV